MSGMATLLRSVQDLLVTFESELAGDDIRRKVQALLPAFESIRQLGKSLVPDGLRMSARDRLLSYFRAYPGQVLAEKELALVAGISEWARRVRELRVQSGWRIITGVTVKAMIDEGDCEPSFLEFGTLSPNDYVLVADDQDRDAAYRWHLANSIRRGPGGAQDKILRYLRANVSAKVTGDELHYVANSSEWARRVRELRTEAGWPISTKMTGNPELPVGVYVLERDRQVPTHDRKIPEATRRGVLLRDNHTCRSCGWTHQRWNQSDPRFLEVHHVVHHAHGGSNDSENLVTYCNVCHDELHKQERKT